MTDPDTLIVAFLRQEYQLAPFAAKTLWVLCGAEECPTTVYKFDISGVSEKSEVFTLLEASFLKGVS